MPVDYRWERSDQDPQVQERRPYDKCPHCGEYQLVTVKAKRTRIVRASTWEYERECDWCRYAEAAIEYNSRGQPVEEGEPVREPLTQAQLQQSQSQGQQEQPQQSPQSQQVPAAGDQPYYPPDNES